MSAVVIRILTCDGTTSGEVCPNELGGDPDVTSLHQLRAVAYRDHGWHTRGRDLCPDHKPTALKEAHRG